MIRNIGYCQIGYVMEGKSGHISYKNKERWPWLTLFRESAWRGEHWEWFCNSN